MHFPRLAMLVMCLALPMAHAADTLDRIRQTQTITIGN